MAELRRREPDTDKTRARIIEATEALISNHGLAATNVSGVARALGMSHGNVYRHFRSKDDLFAAVAGRWMSEMRTACESSFDPNASEIENLAALILTIRGELFRRVGNAAALDIYHFALERLPEEVQAHHAHRAMLVKRIIGTENGVPEVLDAMRGFTDPVLLIATQGPDTEARVKALCAFILKRRS